MTNELSRFLADVRTDMVLQTLLRDGATNTASVVEIANRRGYRITLAECLDYEEEQSEALADEELDSVAGGDLLSSVFRSMSTAVS